MKVLAELLRGVESETPYGGRAVSWEPLGWAWLKLGARHRRERSEPGGLRVRGVNFLFASESQGVHPHGIREFIRQEDNKVAPLPRAHHSSFHRPRRV